MRKFVKFNPFNFFLKSNNRVGVRVNPNPDPNPRVKLKKIILFFLYFFKNFSHKEGVRLLRHVRLLR